MEQKRQIEQAIIEKAMKYPDFRKRLLEDPKAVIEDQTGIELPASVNLRILEEDPQTVYLVLPFMPDQHDDTELAEAELERVAGGGT